MSAPTPEENRDRIQSLIEEMDYSDPDRIKRYLDWTSRQTNYSAFNKLLILEQMPDATMVGAKGFWRNLGRWPNEAHSIRVYQPNHGKYYLDDMAPAEIRDIIDNHGGVLNGVHAFIKKNGQPAAYRKFIRMGSVCVWDISQTDGDPVESPFPSGPEDDHQILERITQLDDAIYHAAESNGAPIDAINEMEMSPDTTFSGITIGNRGNAVASVSVNSFSGNDTARLMARYALLVSSLNVTAEMLEKLDSDLDLDLATDLAGVMVASKEGVDLSGCLDGILNPRRIAGLKGDSAMEMLKQAEKMAEVTGLILDGVPPEWARAAA